MPTVILNGLAVGIVYGLLAIGLVSTYRVSRIVNFAYGETGMIAAFAYFEIRIGTTGPGYIVHHDRGSLVALPVAVAIGAAVGAAMERIIARPLRGGSPLSGMVATIGAATLLTTFAARRYGFQLHRSQPLVAGAGIHLLGLRVSPSELLICGCVAVILPTLGVIYRFTSFGLGLRATAQDPYAAGLSGVNINATATITWAVAGGLSGLSAILISSLFPFDIFFMTLLALRSFAAAIVGGLTSIGGGFLAGVVLGVAESVIAYKAPVTGITDVVVAVVIVVMLLVRPGGLVRADY